MKKTILYITLCFFILYGCTNQKKTNECRFNSIDISNTNKLMIVAHPDDETIWGGYHLLEGNYLILCITNGDNQIRKNEFLKVVNATKNQGIILNYPDKTNGTRDNWNKDKYKIYRDICTIINKKKFNLIVTHNPDGEYGHIHHKLTSELVSKTVKDKSKLYYFGTYYKKNKMPKYIFPYPHPNSIDKHELTNLYSSQKKVMKHLNHMFEYENWIPANDWSEKNG